MGKPRHYQVTVDASMQDKVRAIRQLARWWQRGFPEQLRRLTARFKTLRERS